MFGSEAVAVGMEAIGGRGSIWTTSWCVVEDDDEGLSFNEEAENEERPLLLFGESEIAKATKKVKIIKVTRSIIHYKQCGKEFRIFLLLFYEKSSSKTKKNDYT